MQTIMSPQLSDLLEHTHHFIGRFRPENAEQQKLLRDAEEAVKAVEQSEGTGQELCNILRGTAIRAEPHAPLITACFYLMAKEIRKLSPAEHRQ